MWKRIPFQLRDVIRSIPVVSLLSVTLIFNQCSSHDFPDRLPLEGDWYFRYDPQEVGLSENWHLQYRPGKGWETVPLGASWASDYDGAGWYQKKLWLPEIKTDRNLALVITGTDDRLSAWLNGSAVELNRPGNNTTAGDITDLIKGKGQNLFVIQVVDTAGPGGLTGDVRIQKYVNTNELN